MLDPLTANSLASSIFQFVDFSSKILIKTVEIYRDESTSDQKRADLDVGIVCKDLIAVTEQLRPSDEILTAPTKQEAALLELRDSCARLGGELIDIFQSVSKTVQTGRGKKVKEIWQSLCKAIRRVWNEARIKEMQDRLNRMTQELDLHTSVEMQADFKAFQRQVADNQDSLLDRMTDLQDAIIVHTTASLKNLRSWSNRYWVLVLVVPIMMQACFYSFHEWQRRQKEKEEHRGKITDWLTTLDFAQKQADVLASRHQDTGNWLLNTTELNDWLQGSRPTLWLNGIPGSGKTVLTSIVVDHLQRNLQVPASSVGISYIYCDYKDHVQQTEVNIIASLLKQLIQGRPGSPLSQQLETLYDESVTRRTRPSLESLYLTLQSQISSLKNAFVIIDALDECLESSGSRRTFIRKMGDLSPSIKLMVTSRPHVSVTHHLANVQPLEVLADDEDIRKYVAGRVLDPSKQLARVVEGNDILQQKIVQNIISKAKGMFLLAQLHMDLLSDKSSLKAVRRTLDDLPKDLQEAHQKAMERIEVQKPDARQTANEVLYWLSTAIRPLRVIELQHALAVEPGERNFDAEGIKDVEYLLYVCAGLVKVEKKSNIIRLVHYSTQEFLKSIRNDLIPKGQARIASTCLTYLSYDAYARHNCSTRKGIDLILLRNPFYSYSTQYWGEHARRYSDNTTTEGILNFLNQEDALFCSIQAKIVLVREDPYSIWKPICKLCVAAEFGLNRVVRRLLDRRVDLEATTMSFQGPQPGETALQAASGNGHVQVVQLLLDKGADPNTHSGEWQESPLTDCAAKGQILIARLLLEKGADPSAWSLKWSDPLRAASFNGHAEIVQMLLDAGADVNTHGGSLGSALQAASINGHRDVAHLLLKNGADIDIFGFGKDEYWKQPTDLLAPSRNQHTAHEERIFALRRKDHYFRAQSVDCWNPLLCASLYGHFQVVRLLIESGAKLDVRMNTAISLDGADALQVASYGGFEKIVRLLIEKGADVNAGSSLFGNAVQAASIYGHVEVVRLLLENGAHANTKRGAYFGNALQTASSKGHTEVVRLLLEKRHPWYRLVSKVCNWLLPPAIFGLLEKYGRHNLCYAF